MKPDFIVPGAGKSGTSTLNQYLEQHPAICISRPAEPMFFSHDRPNAPRLGMVGFEDGFEAYARCFSHCKEGVLRGEGSTSYMFFPGVIARLLEHVPNARFVFIFRNPVDRVYSHYNFNRQYGSENRPFRQAFESSSHLEVKTWGNRTDWGGYYYYYHNGLSGEWLEKYIQSFGPDRVHVISFENLISTPIETMNGVFRFLGVDALDQLHHQHSNKTTILEHPKLTFYSKAVWKQIKGTKIGTFLERIAIKDMVRERLQQELPVSPLAEGDRAWLADVFQEDVARLKRMTGREWSEWNDF